MITLKLHSVKFKISGSQNILRLFSTKVSKKNIYIFSGLSETKKKLKSSSIIINFDKTSFYMFCYNNIKTKTNSYMFACAET